ncbi:FAD-dependent oxidoreductase [Actinomycetospora corticicola]|uniref:Fumarate reductase flavoprotein subunit n=1 Tax=Actinomycetospora corticicola TaxID=663602 RepID=A0A7Y9J3V9_9PSEU|nr:FAD-binding protein [Actinomycetospora corticicola]NYD34251.1 fumarate reductase flavoprotein subunit [Actinomycetospora corticicola]
MADVDLLVAGAGGGLAGALRAAERGLQVVVAEANPHFRRGNNTAMSTAMIPGPGSRFQRAAGVEDSQERFLADVAAKTRGEADPVVAKTLAGVGAEVVEWLADHVGLPVELAAVDYPGHSVRRCHTLPGHHGSTLLRGLADAVEASSSIDLLVPARLTGLEPVPVSSDGAPRSERQEWRVTLTRPDGGSEQLTAAAVLLATNGYGASPELVGRHLPEIAGAAYHGSEYSTGDALRLGGELGAATGFLDAYQGHAGLSAAARTLVTWTTVMAGGIVVDADGRRFGDETVGYSEYAAMLAARPGARGWAVFDARIDAATQGFTDYRDVVEAGAVRWGATVPELADRIGVDPAVLEEEIADAAAVARGEVVADRVGRRSVTAPLEAPYAAVGIVPALFHTQGGLAVDADARVLDPAGRPLGSLHASGGAAVGMSGHGAAGYLAGNGLLPALGLAYRAADHVASAASTHPVRKVHA